jgi:fructose-1,6-bisphosphatase/sedoheptulose 1,7-bisphosphatase-like protein
MGGYVTYTPQHSRERSDRRGLMRGVRLFGGGHRVSSFIMSRSEHLIRFVDSVHTEEGADSVVEF